MDLVTEPLSWFVEFLVLFVLRALVALDFDDDAFLGCGVGGSGAVEGAIDGGRLDDHRATRAAASSISTSVSLAAAATPTTIKPIASISGG